MRSRLTIRKPVDRYLSIIPYALAVALVLGTAPVLSAETIVDAQKRACPETWKLLDRVISVNTNTVPWASSSDKTDFKDYLKDYLITATRSESPASATYADDVLTVASECALRTGPVVDQYFGKSTSNTDFVDRKLRLKVLMMVFDED